MLLMIVLVALLNLDRIHLDANGSADMSMLFDGENCREKEETNKSQYRHHGTSRTEQVEKAMTHI